jgi:type VI secretion system protein ImpH
MASQDGQKTHRVIQRQAELDQLFTQLVQSPFRFDFFSTLRRIEALDASAPLLGRAPSPKQESVRLSQQPSLTFAPSNLTEFRIDRNGRGVLSIRFMGLYGPHGALPVHLTELTQERIASHNDQTMRAFADMFHHRMLLHFYRAWRQSQPTANRDRPKDDRFMTYVGAFVGQYSKALDQRDAVDDKAIRYFAGQLGRLGKSALGLQQILSYVFQTTVEVNEFAATWLRLPESERTRLGAGISTSQLGAGATLGAKVLDAQHNVSIQLGPLNFEKYQKILPGQSGAKVLTAWLNRYLGMSIGVKSVHVLQREAVPKNSLGKFGQLGWTVWLGTRQTPKDAFDMKITHNILNVNKER